MDTPAKPKAPSRAILARHLAEELGVSVSTISRAFSPDSNVAPETRDRVLARAKAIGYRPNPFARSLSTQRTRIVSIFISDIFNNPFYPEMLASLTEALQQQGLSVMLFHVPTGKTPNEVLPQALLYQPEYVVIMTATVSFQNAIATTDAGTHLIFFNRYVPGTNTFSVTCDNVRGGQDIAAFLLASGHRRMAYIAGTPGATTSIERGRGFVERCRTEGIAVVEDHQSRVFSYEDGGAAAKRLMQSHPDLDAIFCANDVVAMGALDALRYDLGMDVPRDVSVIGFDDMSMAGWTSHSLTTYRHPMREMATATVDLIREIDENALAAPVVLRLPGELVVRATHRDRRADPGAALPA